jgi:hypothetical protein
MLGIVYRTGRFIPPFFADFFRTFSYISLDIFGLFFSFSVSLKHYRPSSASFASFIRTLGVVVTKHNWQANVVGKGSVLVAFEQDLEQRKDALGPRRIWRHGEGDSGRLARGPDFRGMVFPPTQNLFREVTLIAVANGNAISSRDLIRQGALESRHEVRPLPNGLTSASRATRSNVTLLSAT